MIPRRIAASRSRLSARARSTSVSSRKQSAPGTCSSAANTPSMKSLAARSGSTPAEPPPCRIVAASRMPNVATASTTAAPISPSRSAANFSASPSPTTSTALAATGEVAVGKNWLPPKCVSSAPRAARRERAPPSTASIAASAPPGGTPLRWFTTMIVARAAVMSPWARRTTNGREPSAPGIASAPLDGALVLLQEAVPAVGLGEAQVLVEARDRVGRRRKVHRDPPAVLDLRPEVAFGDDVAAGLERGEHLLGGALDACIAHGARQVATEGAQVHQVHHEAGAARVGLVHLGPVRLQARPQGLLEPVERLGERPDLRGLHRRLRDGPLRRLGAIRLDVAVHDDLPQLGWALFRPRGKIGKDPVVAPAGARLQLLRADDHPRLPLHLVRDLQRAHQAGVHPQQVDRVADRLRRELHDVAQLL